MFESTACFTLCLFLFHLFVSCLCSLKHDPIDLELRLGLNPMSNQSPVQSVQVEISKKEKNKRDRLDYKPTKLLQKDSNRASKRESQRRHRVRIKESVSMIIQFLKDYTAEHLDILH